MYLLATVSARDFGWIGTVETVERLEATLSTVASLERFRGHLYNWYDTRTLERLEPRYVSTVDSGNLAGHLIAVSNACRQMIDRPLPVAAAIAGIGDAIALVRRAAGTIDDEQRSQVQVRRRLDDSFASLAATADVPATVDTWANDLEKLSMAARMFPDVAGDSSDERADRRDSELVTWVEAVQSAVQSHVRDVSILQPGGAGPSSRHSPKHPIRRRT